MHDRGKVVLGLLIFFALFAFPLWFMGASGGKGTMPALAYPPAEYGRCIADSVTMRAHHMDTLNEWRDGVVREGRRVVTTADGRRFEASLTNTCLGCHVDRAAFCDKCHGFMAVDPFCWDCHVDRKQAGAPADQPAHPAPAAPATEATAPAGTEEAI